MNEEWKPIKGLESKYMVSSFGRVKSIGRFVATKNGDRFYRGRLLKLQIHNQGYLSIKLGGYYQSLVHRLVSIAFIENPENLEFINHKDGEKKNNKINNLEWVTRQENEKHAFETGLKNSTGSHNVMAKINESDAIIIFSKKGLESLIKLSIEYNVCKDTISRIWHKKTWKHIHI